MRRVGSIREMKREGSRAESGYQGPRKTLCLSTGDRSGLASLEQAFHIWYHLSSTETSEECLGVPREVVPLSGKALTCLRGTTPLTLDLNGKPTFK
jgi:hypothetical protein